MQQQIGTAQTPIPGDVVTSNPNKLAAERDALSILIDRRKIST